MGWFFACASQSGCSYSALLNIGQVFVTAVENQGPNVYAAGSNNLWYQGGKWVRGTWPISFWASDPSGVCSMKAVIGSQTFYGPSSTKNQDAWQQCPQQAWPQQVDTRASKAA